MRRLVDAIDWISNHQTTTGLATLAGTALGLIAAVRSEDALLRLAGVIFATLAGLGLLWVCRRAFASIANWLTWKFALGVVFGIAISGLLLPLLSPFMAQILPSSSKAKVELTHTKPSANSMLRAATDRVEFYFSEAMSRSQRSGVSVTITPPYPIEWYWIVNEYSEETRLLKIAPAKYYPNERLPRYEYGMVFSIEVKGGALQEPSIAKFRAPMKEPFEALSDG